DWGRLYPVNLNVGADTELALPELAAQVRTLLDGKSDVVKQRGSRIAEARTAGRAKAEAELQHELGKRPISHAQLAQATWNVIKGEQNWVVSGDRGPWLRRIWTMDRPGCTGGGGGAGAVGTNMPKAIGASLAAKRAGGFGISYTGDGDLYYV